MVPPFFSESDVRQQGSKRSTGSKKNKATTASKKIIKSSTAKSKRNDGSGTTTTDNPIGDPEDDNDHEDEEEEEEDERVYDNAISSASIVTLPRKPSASWLSNLSAKSVLLVAGSGTRCFVLLDEELVSTSLTARLMRNLLFGGKINTADTHQYTLKYPIFFVEYVLLNY